LREGVNTCFEGISGIVMVSWTDGKCQTHAYCHNVELDSCFTHINVIPTL
jgi:hypothetical protein